MADVFQGSALRVISLRCLIVEAPPAGLRHRVRPATVAPFLMSRVAHTPQEGRLVGRDTEYASRAYSPR